VSALKRAFEQARSFALDHPDTREDLPWGESAIKVKGKTFVFMRIDESVFGMTVKLPNLREFALEYPFTKPTGYGLGKSGWVTASFGARDKPPLDILKAWIDESYRTIAPKKLVASLPDKAKPKRTAASRRSS
jgi:predicted DNA-binding protein (MmcQ/YjbR family)